MGLETHWLQKTNHPRNYKISTNKLERWAINQSIFHRQTTLHLSPNQKHKSPANACIFQQKHRQSYITHRTRDFRQLFAETNFAILKKIFVRFCVYPTIFLTVCSTVLFNQSTSSKYF
jgi:hypothetical protein